MLAAVGLGFATFAAGSSAWAGEVALAESAVGAADWPAGAGAEETVGAAEGPGGAVGSAAAPGGAVIGTAVVRATRRWVCLKVKGDAGRALFYRREGEGVRVRGRRPDAQKRRGAGMIGSSRNLRDPYVVQLRFTPEGERVEPPSWRLYHSLAANRVYGEARLEGDVLVVSGEAGVALGRVVGGGEVVRVAVGHGGGAEVIRGE